MSPEKCEPGCYDVRIHARVAELVDLFASKLKLEAEHLYRSGCVDVEAYDPFEYALPKILLAAAIERTKGDYAPASRDTERRSDIQNLTKV